MPTLTLEARQHERVQVEESRPCGTPSSWLLLSREVMCSVVDCIVYRYRLYAFSRQYALDLLKSKVRL